MDSRSKLDSLANTPVIYLVSFLIDGDLVIRAFNNKELAEEYRIKMLSGAGVRFTDSLNPVRAFYVFDGEPPMIKAHYITIKFNREKVYYYTKDVHVNSPDDVKVERKAWIDYMGGQVKSVSLISKDDAIQAAEEMLAKYLEHIEDECGECCG